MDNRAEALSPNDPDRPTLLPSPFPNEPTNLSGGAEGYEGERLHEMFLAAKRGLHVDQDTSSRSRDLDTNIEDAAHGVDEEMTTFDGFFTVVEDSITGEQHHPYVYYVFSDDDPELVTNVLLHTIHRESEIETSESAGSGEDTASEDRVHERYILLDMASDGRTVVSVQSLAPDWQILNYQVTPAPTFSETSDEGETGLMLRIGGQERPKYEDPPDKLNKQSGQRDMNEEDMLESMNRLVEKFHNEMDALTRLASSDKLSDSLNELDAT